MNQLKHNSSLDSLSPIDWWIVATIVACLWLGLAWSITLISSISDSKYLPITPAWEIVTEQSSNAKKVMVILDQVLTLQENGISDEQIFNCTIKDWEVVVSDLKISDDIGLGMYVAESRKDWLEFAQIKDIDLNGRIKNKKGQKLYDKWLNILIQEDIVKKCSK